MIRSVARAVIPTFLVLFLLECWRPYFFLTDDNLTGGFPIFTEIGRNISHGQAPFTLHYTFNGHYNVLRDPSGVVWHPIYLVAYLLALTPLHFWIIDFCGWSFALISVTGFVVLGKHLQKQFSLPVSDPLIAFYAISYTFSLYALTISSSWMTEYGNLSAMPWLAYGLFQTSFRRGAIITALAFAHTLLCGQMEATISAFLWLTILSLGFSYYRKSWLPFGSWIVGHALAVICLIPALIPPIIGFTHCVRSSGASLYDIGHPNFTWLGLFTSYFCGPWAYACGGACIDLTIPFIYAASMASCVAAWCLIIALVRKGRWSVVDIACGVTILLLAFMMVRPEWVNSIVSHIPIFKSFRWPYRELLQFLFFIHLFLILRTPVLTKWTRPILVLGAFLFLIRLPFNAAPSMNVMLTDRYLILTGRADAYWSEVKPLLVPDAPTVSVFRTEDVDDDDVNQVILPFTMMNTYNYPALFQVRGISGYSTTVPTDQLGTRVMPSYQFGAFSPEQADAVNQLGPRCNIIVMESAKPVRLTLYRPDGKVIDLTQIAHKYLPSVKSNGSGE